MTTIDWLRRLTNPALSNYSTTRSLGDKPWNVFDGENWWTVVTNGKAMAFLEGNMKELEPPPHHVEGLLRYLTIKAPPQEPVDLGELKRWCGLPWEECPECKGVRYHHSSLTRDSRVDHPCTA